MQFFSPEASLAATIPLHIQSTSGSNIPDLDANTSRATKGPSTLNDNQEDEDNLPQSLLNKNLTAPPQHTPESIQSPATTPYPTAATPLPTPVKPRDLNIKIIGAIPFTHILQDGTPTFQLQITPALPEEYLHTETTLLEQKTEEQILYKVVPLEYH
ncbi:hypothetical protein E4T56_gene4525 [Termitomyces sp. T112]|nr:hypothetical protein E4T56_gene4525 [Termitomyces sp. T112]